MRAKWFDEGYLGHMINNSVFLEQNRITEETLFHLVRTPSVVIKKLFFT